MCRLTALDMTTPPLGVDFSLDKSSAIGLVCKKNESFFFLLGLRMKKKNEKKNPTTVCIGLYFGYEI